MLNKDCSWLEEFLDQSTIYMIAGVTRYLEFKSIEGSYVMGKSGKISKVGSCSRY